MYNIQSENNYVVLSSIIQLINYMFRPLNLAIIRFVLSLQRAVLHNQCYLQHHDHDNAVTVADYNTTQPPPHSIVCKQT